jgi:hypothetical protein
VTYWKTWLALLFLPVFAAQLPAQWRSNRSSRANADPMGSCNDIEVDVRDSTGTAISNAVVTTDNGVMPFATDSRGLAAIPCLAVSDVFTMLEVRAPGYYPSRVMMANNGPRFLVILDKRDGIKEGSETTINAQELRRDVQAKSRELQDQASKAIGRKDYDTAERLLIQAHELTPSLAMIPNNLGVVELHRKDLDAAGKWFEKAMQIAPYEADIAENLGIVRYMQRREDESYQLLMKAAGMGYETSAGNYIVGTLSLEKGMNRQAVECLKKISPDTFPYRDLYRSIALHNLGKTKAADEAYRDFLKRNPVAYALNVPQK